MKWIHVDIWFQEADWHKDSWLTAEEKKDFEKRIAEFLRAIKGHIRRKFYLYEDIPHCFIALELVHEDESKIRGQLSAFYTAPYIYKAGITTYTQDEKNGEGFLNVLNAMTDMYLFERDARLTHVIHCCLEFITGIRKDEHEFYLNMAILYQPVKICKGKNVPEYKKINNPMRRKLVDFIKRYDLKGDK